MCNALWFIRQAFSEGLHTLAASHDLPAPLQELTERRGYVPRAFVKNPMEPGVVLYVISNHERLLVPVAQAKLAIVPQEVIDPRTRFCQLCRTRIQHEPVLVIHPVGDLGTVSKGSELF